MKIINYLTVIISLIIIVFLFNSYVYKKETLNNKIGVDIKGFVKQPGYYEINTNQKVKDVINMAGGLLENADVTLINLSLNVYDEMVIVIYSKDEVNEMQKGSRLVKYIEKECVCPDVSNNACIDFNQTQIETIFQNNSDNIKININTASIKELTTLSGIGEAKAKSIIEYRTKTLFKKIDDILNVKGIGKAIFEKIKDSISI